MSQHTPSPLVVTEDVQGRSRPGTRCGADGWLVYEPATGPALAQDLVQRGIFWKREDAVLFSAARDLLAALQEVINQCDLEHDDALGSRLARAAIAKAKGEARSQ